MTLHHPILTCILLGIAVFLCAMCSIGLAIVGNAYQRLHFSAPVTSIGILCVVFAIWIEDPSWQSRLKGALIALVLFLMNAILTHATGRAIRIRELGRLSTERDEAIHYVKRDYQAGEKSRP